jgi:hypothetical protein
VKYLALTIALAACGPSHLRVEPVKVEPIHMTIDVNIHDAPEAQKPMKSDR